MRLGESPKECGDAPAEGGYSIEFVLNPLRRLPSPFLAPSALPAGGGANAAGRAPGARLQKGTVPLPAAGPAQGRS